MGFFSGSSTSVVKPVGELFDSGIFSKGKANKKTRQLSKQLLQLINQSGFLQDGGALNDIMKKIESGESFLTNRERGSVLDQAQSQFNKRGLSRITENEALSALAPFENQARQTGIQAAGTLAGARSGDLAVLQNLIAESRPDLLVGSTTTNTNNPSGFAKLGALLKIPGMFNSAVNDSKNLGTQFG